MRDMDYRNKGKNITVENAFGEGYLSRNILASFVSGTFVCNGFGEIRVPPLFNKEFGRYIAPDITLFCKEGLKWTAEYDTNEEKIRGMLSFLLHHKARQNNILIFDYHGKSEFSVQVYKSCGIEVEFDVADTIKCRHPLRAEDLRNTEYVVERDWLDNAKSAELLSSTGFFEWGGCNYQIKVTESTICEPHGSLPLVIGIEETYKHWNDRDTVYLIVRNLGWKVKVIMSGPYRLGGSGWFKFVEEIGLQVGDDLLLRTIPGKHVVYVSVIKKEDVIDAKPSPGKMQNRRVSFFQFAHMESLSKNLIAPPHIVEENYHGLLVKVSSVLCGGHEWPFIYWNGSRHFKSCSPLFKKFNVHEKDTIFITVTGGSRAQMRIYRRNGMELLYDANGSDAKHSTGKWYLDEIFDAKFLKDANSAEVGIEEVPAVPDRNARPLNSNLSFSAQLIASHVDKKSHGPYIGKTLESRVGHWNAETKLVLYAKRDNWQIGVNMTNNRIRLCSGWNKFVRDNELQIGDTLTFHLLEDGVSFRVDIKETTKCAAIKSQK